MKITTITITARETYIFTENKNLMNDQWMKINNKKKNKKKLWSRRRKGTITATNKHT